MGVEQVLQKLGIHVTEKQRGRLWARCPYHEDKHASWFVRDTGTRYGQWHCFSCKAGGTLTMLVMHVKGISYEGAKTWLEDFGSMPAEPEPLPAGIQLEIASPTSRVFQLPREVDFGPLEDWPSPVRAYAHARGLTDEQVERWQIGYAVSGRLEGRLVIPIFTRDGRPASYSARTFADSDRRYLYPREIERAELDVMFGEARWFTRQTVVVTEGAIDALACERAGAHEVAALGGSLVRPMHVMKLSVFRHVLVLTDADGAGEHAADELMTALCRHTKVERARLPVGSDAASVSVEALRRVLWQVPGTSTTP